jgi:hypothetical protein
MKTAEEKDFERRLAATNLAMLACYDALYTGLPAGMVEHVFKMLIKMDYFTPHTKLVKLAKMCALRWLLDQAEKENSNTDKLQPSVLRLLDGGSDKKGNKQS